MMKRVLKDNLKHTPMVGAPALISVSLGRGPRPICALERSRDLGIVVDDHFSIGIK